MDRTKIAVIRVRGNVNLRSEVKSTFEALNLHTKNWCVVLENTPSVLGMLATVKDFCTWGDITEDMLKELVAKRGEPFDERTEDSKSKIQYKYFEYDGKKYNRVFRLNSPVHSYGRMGVKFGFADGGALGNRKEKINDLLKRMI
ncbi:MAG: 50S ribosomal protein L30 [Nanoarchaeota archaeon]|nr:50S ribosomal protein L30 [Nanoarchaeota archaeon]